MPVSRVLVYSVFCIPYKSDPDSTGKSVQSETWRALEELVDQGLIKALGVSNFDERELRHLIATPHLKHKPAVLQNKFDVYHLGKQLDNRGDHVLEYARSEDILPVAYSPFSAYPFSMRPTDDPIVRYVTREYSEHFVHHEVTEAQVLLRWSLQHGIAAIPRSATEANLHDNLLAMALPPIPRYLMEVLDTLQYLVESPVSVAVPIKDGGHVTLPVHGDTSQHEHEEHAHAHEHTHEIHH
jgi:diketogulonate reductase-like aldo/keto reductase